MPILNRIFNEGDKRMAPLANKLGIPLRKSLPLLGEGAFAKAYSLKTKQVLKKTNQSSDLKLAERLKEEPLWGFVQVYDAGKVTRYKYYSVVEKLKPARAKWARFIDEMNEKTFDPQQGFFYLSKKDSKFKQRYKEQMEWLDMLAQECFINGLRFTDIHCENIMMREDGTHVISDLGYSKVVGKRV